MKFKDYCESVAEGTTYYCRADDPHYVATKVLGEKFFHDKDLTVEILIEFAKSFLTKETAEIHSASIEKECKSLIKGWKDLIALHK